MFIIDFYKKCKCVPNSSNTNRPLQKLYCSVGFVQLAIGVSECITIGEVAMVLYCIY